MASNEQDLVLNSQVSVSVSECRHGSTQFSRENTYPSGLPAARNNSSKLFKCSDGLLKRSPSIISVQQTSGQRLPQCSVELTAQEEYFTGNGSSYRGGSIHLCLCKGQKHTHTWRGIWTTVWRARGEAGHRQVVRKFLREFYLFGGLAIFFGR